MYASKVSVENFGPFPEADFAFSEEGINLVVGNNATGKTQLCGAIIAAIVGPSALEIREGCNGPSSVAVELVEESTVEVSSITVSQPKGKVVVSHAACPLAIKIMATMSDPCGPSLLLSEETLDRRSVEVEVELLEQFVPAKLKQSELWMQIAKNGVASRIASRGEQALMSLVREVAVRKRTDVKIPLLVDDFSIWRDEQTRSFGTEILHAISESSQVIVFSSRPSEMLSKNALVLKSPAEIRNSLAGYNYRSFTLPRPRQQSRGKRLLWIRGGKFPRQEDRVCELKEVRGGHPVASIKSLVDQYAVAFMNAGRPQAGSIFWGVRDDLSIVGVHLTDHDCDELRRVVTEKLHQIVPAIAPTAYEIELHPVRDGVAAIENLYIVEVRIPAVRRTLLFATGGQEVYVKTDGGKRRLSVVEIQYELPRRAGIDPTF
jgi:hypothetical protein